MTRDGWYKTCVCVGCILHAQGSLGEKAQARELHDPMWLPADRSQAQTFAP